VTRLHRWLAAAAALAGGLAPLADRRHAIDVHALATEVASQRDHLSGGELAGWRRARRAPHRVIDVRSPSEFGAYHVPTAENVPLDTLTATRFAPDDTIVLYSEAGVHGAQAWVFLRALGYHRVYFLRRGLDEWLDDVMSPTLAPDASPAERAEFQRIAELSRWFGGFPRELTVGTPVLLRGRGC
jgi:rhodanese-related sulfurtransferase